MIDLKLSLKFPYYKNRVLSINLLLVYTIDKEQCNVIQEEKGFKFEESRVQVPGRTVIYDYVLQLLFPPIFFLRINRSLLL